MITPDEHRLSRQAISDMTPEQAAAPVRGPSYMPQEPRMRAQAAKEAPKERRKRNNLERLKRDKKVKARREARAKSPKILDMTVTVNE